MNLSKAIGIGLVCTIAFLFGCMAASGSMHWVGSLLPSFAQALITRQADPLYADEISLWPFAALAVSLPWLLWALRADGVKWGLRDVTPAAASYAIMMCLYDRIGTLASVPDMYCFAVGTIFSLFTFWARTVPALRGV